MASYKSLAKTQHKLLMLVIEHGSKAKIVRDELKKYAHEFMLDPIFLKLQ